MFEFTPKQNERVEKIETELGTLENERDIAKALIAEGLLGEDDQIPPHLVGQVQKIMESMTIPNIETAREVVVLGVAIDTEVENGGGPAETVLSMQDELEKIIKKLLAEFPGTNEEVINLVIGRAIDTKGGNYFADTLHDVVEERKEIMRNLPTGKYSVDTKTNIAFKTAKKSNSPEGVE